MSTSSRLQYGQTRPLARPRSPTPSSETSKRQRLGSRSPSPIKDVPNALPKTKATDSDPKEMPVELPDVQELALAVTSSQSQPRIDVRSKRAENPQGKKDKSSKRRKQKRTLPEPYSPEDVLWRDVLSLLSPEQAESVREAEEWQWESPYGFKEEVTVRVGIVGSNGESFALTSHPLTTAKDSSTPKSKPWVVITPFALPGELIKVRVYRHGRLCSFADLVEVIEPNLELRDQSRVRCRYFGQCAGCQYQMLSYETQLDWKRNVVVKAYKNFSGLPSESIPVIGSTIDSPLQYNYRTKITPHFEAPPRWVKKAKENGEDEKTDAQGKPEWLNIGFNKIGTRHVLDIEECPIATRVLNEAFGPMREGIIKNIHSYKKGVSLLLRDSLELSSEASSKSLEAEKHICITDHKATVRERVGDKLFEYTAGSFFQNNNSVLAPLTQYVKDAIFPPSAEASTSREELSHLVDAYCGAGLFAITLSSHFQKVAGIELSTASIASATHNALTLNQPPLEHCSFRSGDASSIFESVKPDFPPEKSVLIIDPPRKGSDEKFLKQLLEWGPRVVVYVSCNVHTQARDVGVLLRAEGVAGGRGRYRLESLRGFDLFPQTAHVESVAVLRLL